MNLYLCKDPQASPILLIEEQDHRGCLKKCYSRDIRNDIIEMTIEVVEGEY